MSNSAASPDGVSPWNGSRSPSGPGDYVSQREALGRFGNKLPVFGKTFPSMDRLYLVVIVSAFVVLVTAAGLLVTKTHIVARHAHRPPFVRIGNKLPVFGKTFPGTERSGAVNLPHQSDENREMMVAIAANRTSASPRTLSSASTLQQSNSALTRSL